MAVQVDIVARVQACSPKPDISEADNKQKRSQATAILKKKAINSERLLRSLKDRCLGALRFWSPLQNGEHPPFGIRVQERDSESTAVLPSQRFFSFGWRSRLLDQGRLLKF
ncbi:hypothetical protein MC885_012229 [Smutsia gigantea]|nr:hypothetical protein MC885_012229 [Smutsia gigantea]